MILVVDTNILFSACLSPNNTLSEILFSPLPHLKRISCYYAVGELFKHQAKLIELSRQPADKISTLLYAILKQVEFFNEQTLAASALREAEYLTAGVDHDDIAFVALALQEKAWLWTGDKKLTAHLKMMGFMQITNTQDLYEMLNIG